MRYLLWFCAADRDVKIKGGSGLPGAPLLAWKRRTLSSRYGAPDTWHATHRGGEPVPVSAPGATEASARGSLRRYDPDDQSGPGDGGSRRRGPLGTSHGAAYPVNLNGDSCCYLPHPNRSGRRTEVVSRTRRGRRDLVRAPLGEPDVEHGPGPLARHRGDDCLRASEGACEAHPGVGHEPRHGDGQRLSVTDCLQTRQVQGQSGLGDRRTHRRCANHEIHR
jgi:hypothetical protein